VKRALSASQKQVKARAIALAQHGVISRAQAVSLGMDSAAISRRVTSGAWLRVLPGVFQFAGAPMTQTSWMHAILQWAGPGAALSGRTALSLWGFPCSFDSLDVTTPQRRDARVECKLHQVVRLPEGHVTMLKGLRVTTPERTLMDVAKLTPVLPMRAYEYEFVPDETLNQAIEFAYERGLTTPERLLAFCKDSQNRGLAGRRMLERAVRARLKDDFSLHPLELKTRVRTFIEKEQLHPLDEDIPLGPSGQVVPFGYKSLRLALLFPGVDSFDRRIPQLKVALQQEGWSALEVSTRHFELDPEFVALRLNFHVSSLGGQTAPPRRDWPVNRHWAEKWVKIRVNECVKDWRDDAGGPWHKRIMFNPEYTPSCRAPKSWADPEAAVALFGERASGLDM